MMSLSIMFGIVSSQLGFVDIFEFVYVFANSHHLANLANVDN